MRLGTGQSKIERVDFPRPPREIRRKAWSGCLIQFFILPHTLVGVAVLLAIVGQLGLLTFGHSTPARVTKQEMYTSKKGSTGYWLDYSYQSGGQTYTDRDSVSLDAYRRFTVGSELRVKSFHIGGHGTSLLTDPIGPTLKTLGLFFVWGAFWNGAVSIFVWHFYVVPLRRRWLAKNGEATRGMIVGKRKTPGRGGKGVLSWVVRYAYEVPGEERQTREMPVNKAEFERAVIGEEKVVLYSPAKPRRSILYDFGDYFVLDLYGRNL